MKNDTFILGKFSHPKVLSEIDCILRTAVLSGRRSDAIFKGVPYRAEYPLRTKSGEHLWFLARGQAIWNTEGNAIRMSGSIQDITDLKYQ